MLVRAENGRIYGFGEGEGGKLGGAAADEQSTPVEITGFHGTPISAVCGANHTFLLTSEFHTRARTQR